MTTWPRLIAAGLLFMTLAAAAQVADGDNPACSPNPVFARFPGERLDSCQHVRFSELKLRRWADPANPRSATQLLTVEGEYWYYHDPIAKDARGRSAGKLEVRRHFESAVRAGGGTVLYVDEGGGRVHFRLPRADGEYWGEVGCGGGGGGDCSAVSQKIVRAAAATQAVGVAGMTPAPAGAGAAGSLTHGALGGGGPAATDPRCGCNGLSRDEVLRLMAGVLTQARQGPSALQLATPAELTAYPARGMRNSVVHLAGPRALEISAVWFDDVPAAIQGAVGDRLAVVVPQAPTQAVRIHVQGPAGRVTLRAPFQVYQLGETSGRTLETPCPSPRGDLVAQATAVAPQRALPGQLIVLTVPGLAALQARMEADAARRAASDNGGLQDGAAALSDALNGIEQIGVAFSRDAADGGSNNPFNPRHDDPVVVPPVPGEGQFLTVRVPRRAVSGPLALVTFRAGMGGSVVVRCAGNGPDLVVAPPPAGRP